MTTLAISTTSASAVAAITGLNAHFDRDGDYQKNSGDADPQAMTVVAGLGATIFRERLANNAGTTQALDGMPAMKIYAHPGDINSSETDIRNLIHTFATSSRKDRIFAITGVNEPNNRNGPAPVWGGAGPWYNQVVTQQYWIWDQVQIEVAAGNWGSTPGVNRPYVFGPGCKHEHVPYDTDIANLAAATYTTAGVTYHMADLCDAGDCHFYQGWNGPGFRMNGKDDNGNVPAGVSLTARDGKVSQESFEIQRARQAYDSKLTGGTGAIVSGHWKYTGGSVTTGHGLSFPMGRSEWGIPVDDESGHSADEWQARGAVFGPEAVLRHFQTLDVNSSPILASIPYEATMDRKTDGLRLGWYNLTNYPTGALPIYQTTHTMLTYTGSESFSAIGAWLDVPGYLPDCGVNAFSAGGGEWYLYVTRNADTTAYLQLAATHQVEGVAISGDGTYHLALSDSLTIWHVMPVDGGGGKPVWTSYKLTDHAKSAAWSTSIVATGATSYAIAAGALPPGMALNTSTGAVTGTPTLEGAYSVTWSATNASGTVESPQVDFKVYIVQAFTAASPPGGNAGDTYEYDFLTSGFPGSFFKLFSGSLPPGLTLTTDGVLSGVPTTAGTYTFRVTASNNPLTPATTGTLTSTIAGSAGGGTLPVWDKFSPPNGQVNVAFGRDFDGDGIGDGYRLHADGGVEDCRYSLASGTLPLGMNLSGSGNLRGTPTEAQDCTFTALATNSAGSVESPPMTFSIVDNQEHGSGQTASYLLEGPNSAVTAYFQVTQSFIRQPTETKPGGTARYAQLEDVNKKVICSFKMKYSGKVDVDDTDGNSIGKGDNFFIPVGSTLADWWRMGLVIGCDGTQTRCSLNLYGVDENGVGSCESLTPIDSIVCDATPSAEPYAITIGNQTGEIYVQADDVMRRAGSVEIPPLDPDKGGGSSLSPAFTLCGTVTTNSALVNTIFDASYAGKTVNLAVSADSQFLSPALVGVQTIDSLGVAHHAVTGLGAPDTWYYARPVDPTTGQMIGEARRFKTQPDGSAAWTRKFAVVSCQSNPGGGTTPQTAYGDILDWDPDVLFDLGDKGYWGQDIDGNDPPTRDMQKYIKVAQLLPQIRRVWNLYAQEGTTISDHELHVNGDDWDGKGSQDPDGAHNCPHSIRQLKAHQSLFPVNFADTRVPMRGRYYSYDIGQQVRVIVTDFRPPDRSNANDNDGPAKTMFGATQLAWILSRLDDSKLNVLVNETSWWHATNLRATDKPAAYGYEQAIIEDYIIGTGTVLDPQYKVDWVGGDRHRGSYTAAGVDNVPFAQCISSGTFKNWLALQDNEQVTWSTPVPDNTVDKFSISLYGQYILDFDGDSTVTRTFNIRQATTIVQVDDGACTSGSSTISSSSAPFVPSHVGQLIAGDGIVNLDSKGNPKPTTVLTVSGDGTTATISNPANKTKAGNGAWTIQNDPSLWQVFDYPGGSLTTDSWTFDGGFGGFSLPEWVEA